MRLIHLAGIAVVFSIVGAAFPVVFEPNRGQVGQSVQFLARAHGYSAFLSPTETLVYVAPSGAPPIRMTLVGAHSADGEGIEPTGGTSNYLKGALGNPRLVGIPQFRGVRYRQIYRGIDLVWRASEDSLEYDFLLAPGSRPNSIQLDFDARSTLRLAANGDLLLESGGLSLRQHAPRAYQDTLSGRRDVPIKFRLLGRNRVTFLAGEYDPAVRLNIDPVLSYASYLGGLGLEVGAAVAIDSAGNIYLTGRTNSVPFPLVSPIKAQLDTATDLGDAFVTKFTQAGNIIYSTYLGGSAEDSALGIAVDSQGDAVVVGFTASADFPLVNSSEAFVRGGPGQCYATVLMVNPAVGCDAFVSKLNPAGSALVFSALLGGSNNDVASAVALDSSGNAYVAGWTASSNFPTTAGVFQSNHKGAQNSFVAKFEPNGKIDYVTLVGGSRTDTANGIAVDSAGNAYVVGDTSSTDFPVVSSVQGANRGGGVNRTDAFVYEVDGQGRSLIFSTFWGGSGDELGLAIALDSKSNVYITGATQSVDFPTTPGVLQTSRDGTRDAFLAKLGPSGVGVLYSTYFGKGGTERADGIAVDANGSAYLAMSVTSTDLPVINGFAGFAGGMSDGYMVRFDAAAANILGSTYYGGSGTDILLKVALDGRGNFYAAGYGDSGNLPMTRGAIQSQAGGGGGDAFVVKVAFTPEVGALAVSPVELDFSGIIGASVPKQKLTLTAEVGTRPNWTIEISSDSKSWLSVSPASGSGTADVDVIVDPASLTANKYSGTLTVVNTSLNTRTPVPVTLALSSPVGPLTTIGVVNGASFQSGPVSPGEIVTIFAPNIGPPTLTGLTLDPSGKVATTLSGTQVLFDNIPAALIYARANQIACVVPYGVGPSPVQLRVARNGSVSVPISLSVTDASPALFTADSSGGGQAAALNEDGSVNGPSNAAPRGSLIVLYGTGEGQTQPAGVDGQVASDVLPKPRLPVTVTIGGKPADLVYWGAAPGAVAGALQLNARIPQDDGPGPQAVTVTVGTRSSSSGVTVTVR